MCRFKEVPQNHFILTYQSWEVNRASLSSKKKPKNKKLDIWRGFNSNNERQKDFAELRIRLSLVSYNIHYVFSCIVIRSKYKITA